MSTTATLLLNALISTSSFDPAYFELPLNLEQHGIRMHDSHDTHDAREHGKYAVTSTGDDAQSSDDIKAAASTTADTILARLLSEARVSGVSRVSISSKTSMGNSVGKADKQGSMDEVQQNM